jgi:hypothetical protein
LISLTSAAFLCGCAHHQYLLQLDNGGQVIAVTKPKLQDGIYHFTDDSGQRDVIPKGRVVKIHAITLVNDEKPSPKSTAPKKQRHWYFLWLA